MQGIGVVTQARLVQRLLDLMEAQGADWTLTFRRLADALRGAPGAVRAQFTEPAAFDSWLGVLSFIEKEKPARWWLDSLQPPDYELCKNGAKIRDEKTGKINKICSSFMDITGCDADMLKLLCPWMVQHV